MGFLDNIRDALKDVVAKQTSKDASAKDAAVTKDDVAVDTSDSTPADDTATLADDTATPPPTEDAREEPEDAREEPEDAREARFETYTVKTGDTLSEIGASFGVSHLEIAKLNGIDNPDLIFPGQVFRIPKN